MKLPQNTLALLRAAAVPALVAGAGSLSACQPAGAAPSSDPLTAAAPLTGEADAGQPAPRPAPPRGCPACGMG
jgi:hypothetical protein